MDDEYSVHRDLFWAVLNNSAGYLLTIGGFHIVGDWIRVCVLWDMGHNTPTARKSTRSFTKSSSLVGFGPILNEIQPFKNFKKFSKKCMNSWTCRTICAASVCIA